MRPCCPNAPYEYCEAPLRGKGSFKSDIQYPALDTMDRPLGSGEVCVVQMHLTGRCVSGAY